MLLHVYVIVFALTCFSPPEKELKDRFEVNREEERDLGGWEIEFQRILLLSLGGQ